MIVKLAFHGLDVVQGLFAQLLLQVRVHVAGVYDQGGSLQKGGPSFRRDTQHVVASNDDDLGFHNSSVLLINQH